MCGSQRIVPMGLPAGMATDAAQRAVNPSRDSVGIPQVPSGSVMQVAHRYALVHDNT